MQMFSESLASDMEAVGSTLTAALLNPTILTHQATHQHNPPPIVQSSDVKYHSRPRPQTPGTFGKAALAPLKPIAQPLRRRLRNQIYQVRSEGSLQNLKSNLESLEPVRTASPSVSLVRYFMFLEDAISNGDSDKLFRLLAKEEVKLLSGQNLMDLLEFSHASIKKTRKESSRALYEDLFEELVANTVPQTNPGALHYFIKRAADPNVPLRIFRAACKNVKLLSKHQLEVLIEDLSKTRIWQRLDRVGKRHLLWFNAVILEIANNLDVPTSILDLEYVKIVLSQRHLGMSDDKFSSAMKHVQFIFKSLKVFADLKRSESSKDPELSTIEVKLWIDNACNDLDLSTETILTYVDEIWKHIFRSMTVDQFESLGRFMVDLRAAFMEQTQLSLISDKLPGIEDLYVFVHLNLKHLTAARFKLFKPKGLTKGQVMALLTVADESIPFESEIIAFLLSKIQITRESFSEVELDSLSSRLQIFIRGIFTFPERTLDSICTRDAELKGSKEVKWSLPEDLFISEDPYKQVDNFVLADAFTNLRRLFLHRVFGIPFSDFGKVQQDADEVPEMKEMHEITNFFIERWCAMQPIRSLPLVKII